MKNKIIIFAILVIAAQFAYAQKPLPGEYRINNNIDKFIGTWQWVSGSDTVTIKLKKIKYSIIDIPYDEDIIMGCHKYVKNGIVIEDYLWKFNSLGQNIKGTIFGWGEIGGDMPIDINKLECVFRDTAKHKMSKIKMNYINTSVPQIGWILYNYSGIIKAPTLLGNTLPNYLTLIKQ